MLSKLLGRWIHWNPATARSIAISGLTHQDGRVAVTWGAEIIAPRMPEAAIICAGKQQFQQNGEAAIDWQTGRGFLKRSDKWKQL